MNRFLPMMLLLAIAVACGPKVQHGAGDYKTRKFKGNPKKSQMDRRKYDSFYHQK